MKLPGFASPCRAPSGSFRLGDTVDRALGYLTKAHERLILPDVARIIGRLRHQAAQALAHYADRKFTGIIGPLLCVRLQPAHAAHHTRQTLCGGVGVS